MQHATMLVDSPATPDGGFVFAQSLATRLCHDLAGTVGALTAALDMAVDGQDDALPLAQDCARELTARLRLLRAAFTDGELEGDIAALAAGLPGADRLTVEVVCREGALGGAGARLAANLLFLAAQALPRGGSIRLSADASGMSLDVDGPRAAWPATLARIVAEPASLADAIAQPRDAGVAMLCTLASRMGLPITIESETRLRAG